MRRGTKYLLISLGHFLVAGCFVVLVMLIAGCGIAPDFRRCGIGYMHDYFFTLKAAPETENLNRVIVLKEVRIHIVGDRKFFNFEPYRKGPNRIAGYAYRDNNIWLLGKVVKCRNGEMRIVVNLETLGHELSHLLTYKDVVYPYIVNPDRMDELGL